MTRQVPTSRPSRLLPLRQSDVAGQRAIPADKPAMSFWLQMTDRTKARLHDMMEAAANKAPTDIKDRVDAFIDALGARPIAANLHLHAESLASA
jgi:hypothetical protein